MQIRSPTPADLPGIVRLSKSFVAENAWAAYIPVGEMTCEDYTKEKIFGAQAMVVLVAENEVGEIIGYTGIYCHPESVYATYLVDAKYRRQGICRQLVEEAFRRLPSGLSVEAWVGDFNLTSLAATPKLGFDLDYILEEDGQRVYVFIRQS